MFDFNNLKEYKQLTAIEQIDRIGEMEIYFKYLGYFPQARKFERSPFARDSTPSLSFRLQDKLLWKCFSSGKGGDCIKLVSELYQISYKDAVRRILSDFKVNDKIQTRPTIQASDRFIRYDTEIQVELQPFSKDDLSYWGQGFIDKDTLDKFDVKVAQKVWLNKGEGFKYTWNYLPKNPIFRYLINGRYKCYRPLEKDKQYKWLGNMTSKEWQGFKQLPNTGKNLVITKSMKDIMVWDKLKIPATSPSSESQLIKPETIKYFYTRFDNIYMNYDFDEAGISQSGKYDLPKIFTYEPHAKDAFDLMKVRGFENAKDVLISQIK